MAIILGVERLMRELGIRARHKRQFKVTINSKHDYQIVPNLLKRQFKVDLPWSQYASKAYQRLLKKKKYHMVCSMRRKGFFVGRLAALAGLAFQTALGRNSSKFK